MGPTSGYEPALDMKKWNSYKALKESHNCFAYAIDTIDYKMVDECNKTPECNVGFPQPGYEAGYKKFSEQPDKGCGDMVMRLWGDNPKVYSAEFSERCKKDMSKIALIVDPKRDYHFLRQDPDGYWSHKPGALPVKRIDSSNRPILRPDRSVYLYKDGNDPLMYTDFCGYYCVPRGKPMHMSTVVQKGGNSGSYASSIRALGDELSSLGSTRKHYQKYFQTRRLRQPRS